MQVDKVNSVYTPNFAKRQNAAKKNDSNVYYVRNEDVLKFGLVGLSIIAASSIATLALKKKNTSPLQVIKNAISNVSKKFKEHPKPDPLIRILDGKRDINAVQMYQKYRSQAKIKSFSDKFLEGQFSDKSGQVLAHMSKNMDKLNRLATRVI